ncbi:ATP F0F1 synthase subunit B [Notoacmeibacter sp. MSK16QG-6]|uniref:F0F1 ATP synthase subunit B family protein n=1 Tax=Notoacmeibacter sp. MSK16QG-6 TaxID=2957982 RepID=UPI0020A10729|nr:ATP F0F1 synthase subunit B [Notoacmeibacter sp. MSK16QG-6]MCP1198265.1 ATP F0F1 synthase subunit B [Notoacmeibacter sp. MSK16QG-6]
MDATTQATWWVFAALIMFLALLGYLGVHKTLAKVLDGRAERIRNELDEARELREEAQGVLAELQRKRREAEEEAEQIVASAKREAESIRKEAAEKSQEYLERRTASAEQKIAQAETDAISAVRNRAIEIATAAARRVISDSVGPEKQQQIIDESLSTIRTKLH